MDKIEMVKEQKPYTAPSFKMFDVLPIVMADVSGSIEDVTDDYPFGLFLLDD